MLEETIRSVNTYQGVVKERNSYFDILRAIAIILVVANHTFHDSTDILTIVISRFIKINVPLFLAISGYFVCAKPIHNKKDYLCFVIKQLKRVYIPLMLFSLPFIFGNGINIRSIVGRTLLSFMGASLYPYYFVFLIAQLYLLLPIYQKVTTKMRLAASCILSFLSIIIVTYLNGYKSADLPLFIYAGLFPVLNMFFAQGCYFRNTNRKYSIIPLLIITPLALVLCGCEDWFWKTYYTPCGTTLTTFVFVFLVVKILFSEVLEKAFNRYNKTLCYKALSKLGRMSFAVFLLHVYIIQWLRNVGLYTNICIIDVVLVLAVSLVILITIERILPKRLHRYIGL